MPSPTYSLISSQVLTSTQTSVTFSSIPASYRDLAIVMTSPAESQFWMRINGDTGSNYFHVRMRSNLSGGGGGNSGTATETVAEFMQSFNGHGVVTAHILEYSATNKHKTILARGGRASTEVSAQVIRWGNTAAINELTFLNTPGTLVSGARLYLYGISA